MIEVWSSRDCGIRSSISVKLDLGCTSLNFLFENSAFKTEPKEKGWTSPQQLIYPKWYNLFVVSSWYQYYSQPQEPSKSKRLVFSNYRIFFFFNEAKSFGRNLKVALSSSSQNSLQSFCLGQLFPWVKRVWIWKTWSFISAQENPSNRVLSNFPGNREVLPLNFK